MLAKRILEQLGYRVWEAASGPAALEVWEKSAPQIDLLLTDMVMPEGVSGRELAERLRERKAGLKMVCSSGYSADALDHEFVLEPA